MLRNQTPAPEFTLTDEFGQERSLSSLRAGRPFLLLFFRGEFCPTAQRVLKDYADVSPRLSSLHAGMAAISTDSLEHHRKLHETLGLPFPLLSDPGFQVSERYGVYRSDDEEGPQPHGEPAVFVIDVEGRLAYSQIQTGPKGGASPEAMALLILYMTQHGGKY